jgi:poly(A) polymerase
LAQEEELASIRPDLDGNDIIEILGIKPGPLVGEAYDYLLELRIEHGPLGRERAIAELGNWSKQQGI